MDHLTLSTQFHDYILHIWFPIKFDPILHSMYGNHKCDQSIAKFLV